MGANLKGLANTLKNKIYQAKKKGIDTSFIPRGYSKLPDSQKLDKIIKILYSKETVEPLITFKPASDKASDKFINERQKEIFNSLDNKEVK